MKEKGDLCWEYESAKILWRSYYFSAQRKIVRNQDFQLHDETRHDYVTHAKGF